TALAAWIAIVFFFFQAEDGIRDRNVTGVQTCALPIYVNLRNIIFYRKGGFMRKKSFHIIGWILLLGIGISWILGEEMLFKMLFRSEERRVGKECRCWWWTECVKEREGRSRDERAYVST